MVIKEFPDGYMDPGSKAKTTTTIVDTSKETDRSGKGTIKYTKAYALQDLNYLYDYFFKLYNCGNSVSVWHDILFKVSMQGTDLNGYSTKFWFYALKVYPNETHDTVNKRCFYQFINGLTKDYRDHVVNCLDDFQENIENVRVFLSRYGPSLSSTIDSSAVNALTAQVAALQADNKRFAELVNSMQASVNATAALDKKRSYDKPKAGQGSKQGQSKQRKGSNQPAPPVQTPPVYGAYPPPYPYYYPYPVPPGQCVPPGINPCYPLYSFF